MYRGSTRAIPCAALAFPSLRRFLTLASACWPQGKIPPHPSARSAHSSPQDGGPKGKMIEGRSGGSGARHSKIIVGPTSQLFSSPPDRRFVSCTDARPEPFPAPPSHRSEERRVGKECLPAGYREKFRKNQAHVQLTRLRRMAGPKGK